jgi:hypothetical protein
MSVSFVSNSRKDSERFSSRSLEGTGMDAGRTRQTQMMRTKTLLIAGAVTVSAGFLLPLPDYILDVLLIFSLSLTAAVWIITFSVNRAAEVSGFPLLIVLAAMLRMSLSAAGSKLILSQGSAGTIIGFFGGILVRENFVLTILGFGALTVLIFLFISAAVKTISRTAEEFVADIVSAKQNSIDNRLDAGLIDHSRAVELHDRIARETGFFAAMTGAARFLLCAAVVELVIVLVDIVGSIITSQAAPATTQMLTGHSFYEGLQSGDLRIHATLGAGVIAQISALLAVAACKYLVRKTYLPCAADGEFIAEEAAERIKVVSSEVLSPPATKSEYGDALVAAQTETVAQDAQWLDEPQCIENGKDDFAREVPLPAEGLGQDLLTGEVGQAFEPCVHLWKAADGKDYYDATTELIESKSGDGTKTILMAAESAKELPVTVPVNIAVRLARKDQRCLLIDFDLQRDAISKVFDIDPKVPDGVLQREAITTASPTGVDNVWVWPVSRLTNAAKDGQNHNLVSVKQAIASIENRYDRLILYAPAIERLADWQGVAACAQAAMLFRSESGLPDDGGDCAMTDFLKVLISYGCDILQPEEILAELG